MGCQNRFINPRTFYFESTHGSRKMSKLFRKVASDAILLVFETKVEVLEHEHKAQVYYQVRGLLVCFSRSSSSSTVVLRRLSN